MIIFEGHINFAKASIVTDYQVECVVFSLSSSYRSGLQKYAAKFTNLCPLKITACMLSAIICSYICMCSYS